MSTINVNEINKASGSTLTLGGSGTTVQPHASATVSGFGLFSCDAIIADQKSSGTNGGAFTSGAWRTRDLNTEVTDVDNIVSLSSNRFTLQAGTYLIIARAPAHDCNSHQTRLRNITDGSTVRFGMNSFLDSRYQGNTNALLIARTTITGAKEFELQHQAESDKTNGGFGVAANYTTEVYTEIEIYKEG